MDGYLLKSAFQAAYPDDFLEEAIRAIFSAYKHSTDECKSFYPAQEAHDLRPHVRRAKIETAMRELTYDFPNIKSRVQPNRRKSGYHTQLISNNVIMTVHAVANPSTLVRFAEFRKTYARSAQLGLFEPELPPPPPDAPLYVLLIHGTNGNHLDLPAFLHAVFPSADLKQYLYRIDILNLPQFGELLSTLTPSPVGPETIGDDLQIGLRMDARNKQRSEGDDTE
jgi:hypothetical protein